MSSSSTSSVPLSIQDYIALSNLVFEWAESYDQKDWGRLKRCLAPSIRLDLRDLHGPLHESIDPDQYVAIHSDPRLIGDPRMKTQHHVGASHWSGIEADGTVRASHQLRVAHQRYTNETFTEVVNHGHGIGVGNHTYKKFGNDWKLVGNRPSVSWTEFDFFETMDESSQKKK